MSIKTLDVSSAKADPRFKKIKLLLLDVDGVLTDGKIMWLQDQGWTRQYSIYDGYGIRLLQSLGLPVGVISGGKSTELKERLKYLQVQHAVLGSEDKLDSLIQISEETKIPFDEICYMGDELFDIPALRKVGLAITVPDASPEVFSECQYVTKRKGGHGAVREVIDVLRAAQDLHPEFLKNPIP